MKNGIGIDNAAGIAGFLGRSVTAVIHIDQDGDGEISRMERFGLAQSVGLDAFSTLGRTDYKALGEEAKDLDATEIMDLVTKYSENQELKDPVLEGILEDGLDWLAQAPKLLERLKDWKSLKSENTEFKSIREISPNLMPVRVRR